MSDIKFETINGTLCRMVEPTPLQLDSQMPCAVRYRKIFVELLEFWTCPKMPFADHRMICNSIKNGVANTSHTNMFAYDSHKIIGYPVVEGSKEWALYQMMQGKAITLFDQPNRIIRLVNGFIQDSMRDGYWNRKSGNEFLSYAAKDGWLIYTEPEPKYKVGDWVEVSAGKNPKQVEIVEIDGDKLYYNTKYAGIMVKTYIHASAITRKLDPSEVVIHIGCLSGTVKPSIYDDGAMLTDEFLLYQDSVKYAIIPFTMLDATTLELVETLLKAQEVGK